jgi:hypothetical protein
MRIWKLPMECLDDRRLNAQHNELHVCLAVLDRRYKAAQGLPVKLGGWANHPQATRWLGKRSALFEYHNDIVLPACRLRWPNSPKYGDPDHVLFREDDLPPEERGFRFWWEVTWEEVLVDIRHLIEKHSRDNAFVDLHRRNGTRTNRVRPRGHNARAIVAVLHRAISHIYGLDPDDTEQLQLVALRLMNEKLLGEPSHNKTTPAERRELRTRKLIAAT